MIEKRSDTRYTEKGKPLRDWYKVWGVKGGTDELDQSVDRRIHYVYAENEQDALKRTQKSRTWEDVHERYAYKLPKDEAVALILILKRGDTPFQMSLKRARDGFIAARTVPNEACGKTVVHMDELIAKEVERMRQERNQGEV